MQTKLIKLLFRSALVAQGVRVYFGNALIRHTAGTLGEILDWGAAVSSWENASDKPWIGRIRQSII